MFFLSLPAIFWKRLYYGTNDAQTPIDVPPYPSNRGLSKSIIAKACQAICCGASFPLSDLQDALYTTFPSIDTWWRDHQDALLSDHVPGTVIHEALNSWSLCGLSAWIPPCGSFEFVANHAIPRAPKAECLHPALLKGLSYYIKSNKNSQGDFSTWLFLSKKSLN